MSDIQSNGSWLVSGATKSHDNLHEAFHYATARIEHSSFLR